MYTRTQSDYVIGTKASKYYIVRDDGKGSREIKFKLDKREYFTGLASLLEVLAEMLEKSRTLQKPPTMHQIELLRALREELEFLQDSCQIIEKE